MSASGIGVNDATINAEIDPTGYATSYRVEYGPSTEYQASAPVPDGDAGSGAEYVQLSVPLTKLLAARTYHYRIVAANANGTATDPDRTFTTWPTPAPAEADRCPNAVLRNGTLSAGLADCRSYEMVTPVDKNGADVFANPGGQGASDVSQQFAAPAAGNKIVFATRTPFGNTHGGGSGGYGQYMATRNAGGWSTKGITPLPALGQLPLFSGTQVEDFSEQFDRGAVHGYALPGGKGGVPNSVNYYLEDLATTQITDTVTQFTNTEETDPFSLLFGLSACSLVGSSSDLGVVALLSRVNLTTLTSGTNSKLYAFEHGALRLAGILPDGTIPAGGVSTPHSECGASIATKDVVSRDGSRIFFTSPSDESAPVQLYMRKNASSTVWVSEPEIAASGSEPPQEITFETATPDGKHAIFTSVDRLTADDPGPGSGGVGLYLFTDSANPEEEPNLTFIARVSPSTAPTRGGQVKGVSQDGSHVYFVSELNRPPLPAHQGGALYLWDHGQIRTVAPSPDGPESPDPEGEARVSPDGTYIAFVNERALTPEAQKTSSGLFREMYVYDERRDVLKCASCPQNGARIESSIDLAPEATTTTNPTYQVHHWQRFLSGEGHYVFFNSREALVPQDTNGLFDAYEYNTETSQVSLLSPGTQAAGTWFVEASADGRDVFLATRDRLSRWDVDDSVDLYDARIDGDLPEPPLAATPCAGDECQGTPAAPPSFNTASGFNGLGNVVFSASGPAKHKRHAHGQALRKALKTCRKQRRTRLRVKCEAAARKHARIKTARHKSAVTGN